MKKNVLLLINGFGIEQNDSYNIYSQELMPNLDKLTKNYLFGSMYSKELDYKTGYRLFSIGVNEPLTYSIVNNSINNESYKENEMLNYIINDTNMTNSKLHIVVYWDNDSTIYHLTTYLKEIQNKLKNKLFIHIIFRQKSLKDYKNIIKSLNVLHYEFGSNIKLGVLVGENNESSYKDFIKMLITESGEKWNDIDKKISVLINNKSKPNESRTFSLGSNYALSDNDSIFFFNYSNVNVSDFTKELINQKYKTIDLKTIKFYSLFPLTCDRVNIPHIYDYAISATSLLNSLKTINAKCLVITKKDYCLDINYYLTGLKGCVDNDIRYMPSDNGFIYDGKTLLDTIISSKQELIIINYEIDGCKTVEEIKDKLSKIDLVIGHIYKYTYDNNIGFFISSLYGLEKELYNNKHELCNINFSVRLPVVVVDKMVNRNNYTLREGNIYDLSFSILKNINGNFKVDGIIKKKGSLLSMFFKKGNKK